MKCSDPHPSTSVAAGKSIMYLSNLLHILHDGGHFFASLHYNAFSQQQDKHYAVDDYVEACKKRIHANPLGNKP